MSMIIDPYRFNGFVYVPKTVTAYGNAQIDTAQYKVGSASGLFDGNGDYLTVPDSDDWYFTGDFTIRFKYRFNVLPSSGSYVRVVCQTQSTNELWNLYFGNSSGTYYMAYLVATGGDYPIYVLRNTGSLSTNTWYDIQFNRSGNDFRIFLEGNQLGAVETNSSPIGNKSSVLYIGKDNIYNGYINGWVDELEIVKGIARNTTNFTPSTTALTPDEYTVLLLHMEGADGSTTFTDG